MIVTPTIAKREALAELARWEARERLVRRNIRYYRALLRDIRRAKKRETYEPPVQDDAM